jgi:hypothetical protein
MGPDETANQVQLSGTKAMAAAKLKWFEPKLAGLVLPFHMNVRRLAAVEAGEEEPIRPRNTSDSRHSKTALPPETHHAIAYLNQAAIAGPGPEGAPNRPRIDNPPHSPTL